MPASKKATKGRSQDRKRVAGGQAHEVKYESTKTGSTAAQAKAAVKKVGTSRKKVETALAKGKNTSQDTAHVPPRRARMHPPDLKAIEKILDSTTQHDKAACAAGTSSSAPSHATAFVHDFAKRVGLEGGDLDRLRREHDAERRRFREDSKRRALADAEAATKRLDATVAAQRIALDGLGGVPFEPTSYILSKVDFIRAWPSPQYLVDSHQEPGVNWAKYRIQDARGAVDFKTAEWVSFYSWWQNTRTHTVFANVLARVQVNGHCSCDADWNGVAEWFFPDSLSRADLSARLTLWGLWTDPAPQFHLNTVPLASLRVNGGFFGGSTEQSIVDSQLVTTSGFPVPAGASILIEASLYVDYELLSGSIDADFSSGGFKVSCPYMIVALPLERSAVAVA